PPRPDIHPITKAIAAVAASSVQKDHRLELDAGEDQRDRSAGAKGIKSATPPEATAGAADPGGTAIGLITGSAGRGGATGTGAGRGAGGAIGSTTAGVGAGPATSISSSESPS